jgi:hypothetical protein
MDLDFGHGFIPRIGSQNYEAVDRCLGPVAESVLPGRRHDRDRVSRGRLGQATHDHDGRRGVEVSVRPPRLA